MLENPVIKSLKELGDSYEEVYNNLIRLKIKGNHKCLTCPIAKYLNMRFPNSEFSIGHAEQIREIKNGAKIIYNYPKPIEDFIAAFGHGMCPKVESV